VRLLEHNGECRAIHPSQRATGEQLFSAWSQSSSHSLAARDALDLDEIVVAKILDASGVERLHWGLPDCWFVLRKKGEPIGVIGLGRQRVEPFTERQIELIVLLLIKE
jgi:hypothetical protein